MAKDDLKDTKDPWYYGINGNSEIGAHLIFVDFLNMLKTFVSIESSHESIFLNTNFLSYMCNTF